MIMRYALIAALLGVLALSGALMLEKGQNTRLIAENTRLTRSVATLTTARDQARTARDVAEAYAARDRAKAAEYEQVRDAFRKGDFDVPLPADFIDLLDSILQ